MKTLKQLQDITKRKEERVIENAAPIRVAGFADDTRESEFTCCKCGYGWNRADIGPYFRPIRLEQFAASQEDWSDARFRSDASDRYLCQRCADNMRELREVVQPSERQKAFGTVPNVAERERNVVIRQGARVVYAVSPNGEYRSPGFNLHPRATTQAEAAIAQRVAANKAQGKKFDREAYLAAKRSAQLTISRLEAGKANTKH